MMNWLFASPVLFRKKRGAALEAAAPAVAEVYGPRCRGNVSGPLSVKGPSDDRAQFSGKILHFANHSLPCRGRQWRVSLLLFLVLGWLCVYPRSLKLRCVACGFIYSFCESVFTHFERGCCYTTVA